MMKTLVLNKMRMLPLKDKIFLYEIQKKIKLKLNYKRNRKRKRKRG